jgi:polysaccharide deacetylase 2 family uncharacterized protein YibQ
VAADDLSAPLGRNPISKRLKIPKLPIAPARPIAAVLGLVLAVFVGWILVVKDPHGGEPRAVVELPALTSQGAKTEVAGAARPETAVRVETPGTPADGRGVVTIIDGSTGKQQEVALAAGGPKSGGGDPRLLEQTRHGMVPKIAADGTRPSDAYAAPRPAAEATDAPRIAIVLTGLGIGTKITETAIAKLPGAMTLAFVPYGTDIEALAAKARDDSHEVLLQVPMEPVDYPDNDPGPQTLLTSLPPEQNIDRMYWTLSRLRGYVGIMNYMGTRLTASEGALSPVLKEASKRGLLYFDDAASARSIAPQIAGTNNIAFAKADVIIDAVPTTGDIGKALTRLEGVARANGTAIGVATALPVTIERLAQWAKTVKGRGFLLVPITVAATRSKSS